ncbi:MAG: hypothetical protein EOL95_03935 [Bacteroidia bacterium]|nr:hypothetical protein [Bacteroidia bacterium]
MKTILYIHGFNSAGGGTKSELLHVALPKYKILSPTFDYKNFDAAVKLLNSLMKVNRPDVVVGTSLGGFLAMYAGYKYNAKCIIINPTTHPSETLARFVGENKNLLTKQKYMFTESDLSKYKDFEDKEFKQISLIDEKTHFLLSNDDELLGDHHYLEQKYFSCKHFSYFDGYGHRFTSTKPIVAAIENLLGK